MENTYKDFGSLVFTEVEMEERLPRPVYDSWKATEANEEQLDRQTADAIAHAMKMGNGTWRNTFHSLVSAFNRRHS